MQPPETTQKSPPEAAGGGQGNLAFMKQPTEKIQKQTQRVNDFLAQCDHVLQQNGLIADSLDTTGRLVRCGTTERPRSKNGAYICHMDAPASLWWMDWATGETGTYSAQTERSMTRAERAAFQERIRKAKEQAQAEQTELHAQAATRAQSLWDRATSTNKEHPYLVKKCIAPHGIRQLNAHLVVPLLDAQGKPQSLQFIDATGTKRFLSGGKTQGGFFHIPDANGVKDGTLLICEGYSTAASLHEATGHACLVSFNAGNLEPVAQIARGKYPQREIILCADNDLDGVGIPKATVAARSIGAKLAIPPAHEGRPTDFNDLHQWIGLDSARACIENAQAAAVPLEPMPLPIPFEQYDLPHIDAQALPQTLAKFCDAVAIALQVPKELPIAACLAAISTATQGRFEVHVWEGYQEPLNTFWFVALVSSDLKTPVLKKCKKPLVAWEAKQAELVAPQIKAIVSERKTMEKVIERRRSDVAKLKDAGEITKLSKEIAELEAALPEIPLPPRLFVDDITPEGLGFFMHHQGGIASAMEAEGGLLDTLAGRYSSGIPNIDLVLKSFSVEPVRIDRRHSESIFLAKPHLTLFLSPQPSVLIDRKGGSVFRGRGLDARFAYLIPQSLAGYREEMPPTVPKHLEHEYNTIITRLIEHPFAMDENGKPTANMLELSPEALATLNTYRKAVKAELRSGGGLHDMPDWGGKAKGLICRIAGLFHCFENYNAPCAKPIQEHTMQNAAYFCGVLAKHAKAAYEMTGQSRATTCAKYILNWIAKRRMDTFYARDCFNDGKTFLHNMEDTNLGLATLEERYFIEKLPKVTTGKIGRPRSDVYKVSPLTYGGKTS